MNQAKAVHLYNLSLHDPVNPILTVHAVASDNYAYKSGINLPVGINHCDRCGVLQVPGLTSRCQVKYSRKVKNSFRSRTLETTCMVCHNQLQKSGLTDKKRVEASVPVVLGEKKKKKKKKSDLASMLAAKKQQEQKPLSLFEFMQ